MAHPVPFFKKENRWIWLIIGLGVLIYGRSLANGFNGEDLFYLLANPSPGSFKGLLGFWRFSGVFSGFPLTVSDLWLEHKILGLHPWGYHAINLAMHILNAWLLWSLVRRIAPALAGMTALLFVIHPIQVETVACIAERKNLLCLFFFLLAFHSFLDFASRQRRRDYLKMFLFFMAALFSKCIAICFVAVPFLYEWWKQGSISRRTFLCALPLFLIGASTILIPIHSESLGTDSLSMTFFEKLILTGKNFFFYLKQIAWPWRFLLFYPKWDIDPTHVWNWTFPAGVGILYLTVYQYRQRLGRGAFALLGFYGVSMFPALGFFSLALFCKTYAADHFSYLSVPPVLLLLCATGQRLWERLRGFDLQGSWKPSRVLLRIMAIGVIIYLSMTSYHLTRQYKNDITLAMEFLLQSPQSSMAYRHFGITCLDNPRACSNDSAVLSLEKASEMDPGDTTTFARLGAAYERKGLYEKAKQAYERAGSLTSNSFLKAYDYRQIARICLDQGDGRGAIHFLEKDRELRSRPDYQDFRRRYLYIEKDLSLCQEDKTDGFFGKAHFLSGDFKKAAEVFQRAIDLAPGEAEHYEGLGAALMSAGDRTNALKAFQKALELSPQSPGLKNNFEYARKKLAEKQ